MVARLIRPGLGRRAVWIVTVLAPLSCLCALCAVRFSNRFASPWTESHLLKVRAHHEIAAQLAPSEFLTDAANKISGIVTGPDGQPVVGALVEVYAKESALTRLFDGREL